MDWTTKLERRGIKILHKDNNNLVIETTNIIDTLFYVSSTNRRNIKNIMADDVLDNWKLIEREILFYEKR